jgi:hypothetical protein
VAAWACEPKVALFLLNKDKSCWSYAFEIPVTIDFSSSLAKPLET